MRRSLLDLFQAFSYGIYCVSMITFSLWVAQASEYNPNDSPNASFEKITHYNSSSSLDWKGIIVSGNSTLSLFSKEKTKTQLTGYSCFFGYESISFFQSIFKLRIYKESKYSSLLDQLHHILFFF